MPQPLARRVALRAAQLAIAAAGIFFILLIFSRQAHAATDGQPSGPLAGTVTSVTSTAGSIVDSAAEPVTAAPASGRPGGTRQPGSAIRPARREAVGRHRDPGGIPDQGSLAVHASRA